MKLKLLIATVVIMLTALSSADAQNRRGVSQRHRTREGVHSGEITRHERRNIGRHERHTRREIRRAKSDGRVSPRERREIRKERRHNSRSIYRKKHNRRDRI